MNTQLLQKKYQHTSPAGAEIRMLMSNAMGGMVHCTLKDGKISKPVTHITVNELWYVISGHGEIWRRQNKDELVTPLYSGVTIDIPLGTDFQYRSIPGSDLVFICITMPPWPGANEVCYLNKGIWVPTE